MVCAIPMMRPLPLKASAAGLARDSILVDGMDNAAELGFEARYEIDSI